MPITERDLEFILEAYGQFNEHKNVIYEKRSRDEKYIDRMLITKDWYYGEDRYQFYTNSTLVCSFTREALNQILSWRRLARQKERSEADE